VRYGSGYEIHSQETITNPPSKFFSGRKCRFDHEWGFTLDLSQNKQIKACHSQACCVILVNMFTEKASSDVPRRGRPSGTTEQGFAARRRLYETAIELIGSNGYDATTMRDVAKAAGVSAGLLYKYFPSKLAVVLEFYEELSLEYASRAASIKSGKWSDRFGFAMRTCLEVLAPHRRALEALAPILVSDPHEGLFALATARSRVRVEGVFAGVVWGSTDAPGGKVSDALGRLLYLLHLAVILWWLLDKSSNQRATHAVVALIGRMLGAFRVALMLPQVRGFVTTADNLVREGLFDDTNMEALS
jgi:AcrR family transcriptional regulator